VGVATSSTVASSARVYGAACIILVCYQHALALIVLVHIMPWLTCVTDVSYLNKYIDQYDINNINDLIKTC